jgi:hypothetical protein
MSWGLFKIDLGLGVFRSLASEGFVLLSFNFLAAFFNLCGFGDAFIASLSGVFPRQRVRVGMFASAR